MKIEGKEKQRGRNVEFKDREQKKVGNEINNK
jgi:hypothetical protein